MEILIKCGSCWAFSALAPIEYAQCVKSGGTYTRLRYSKNNSSISKQKINIDQYFVNVSEQQLVSCDTNDGGCNGGDPSYAYEWLMSSNRKGAVATSASYSYTSGVKTMAFIGKQ